MSFFTKSQASPISLDRSKWDLHTENSPTSYDHEVAKQKAVSAFEPVKNTLNRYLDSKTQLSEPEKNAKENLDGISAAFAFKAVTEVATSEQLKGQIAEEPRHTGTPTLRKN